MKYVEAFGENSPYVYQPGDMSLFLAGGITGCFDWQSSIVESLKDTDLVLLNLLLNPRRKNFPMDDPDASEEQIVWEYKHLSMAAAIMFWFPSETVCPITLFEYGKWLKGNKPLFVGCDLDYQRKSDLLIQTKLERPDLNLFYNLDLLVSHIKSKLFPFNNDKSYNFLRF